MSSAEQKPAARNGLTKFCDHDPARWPKCDCAWHLNERWQGHKFSVSLRRHLKAKGDPNWRRALSLTDAEPIATEIRAIVVANHGTYLAPKPTRATPPSGTAIKFARPIDAATGQPDEKAPEGLAERFVREKLKRGGVETWDNERGMLRKLAACDVPDLGPFGDLSIDTITDSAIEHVFGAVTEGLENSTRKKYRVLLVRLFRWAVAKRLIAATPITDETVLPTAPGTRRTRRVRPDEETNLIEAASEGRTGECSSRLAAMIAAAIETGARKGELLALKWADLDFARRRVEIRAVEKGARKTRRRRTVRLTPRLAEVLEPLRKSPTGAPFAPGCYVFGDAIGGKVANVRKAWETAILRAHNIEPAWSKTGSLMAPSRKALAAIDLHFHDLRHEAALRWHERGVRLTSIATLLGHADLDQLRIYLGIESDDALNDHDAVFVEVDESADEAETPEKPAAKAPTVRKTSGKRGALKLVARRKAG